jgi:hypothetical protein
MPELTRKDGTTTRSEGPARGYKWADAAPGNALAVRHGANSARLVSDRAKVIIDELMGDLPVVS